MLSGGFEDGNYDKCAMHPTSSNWSRQSRYSLPKSPKLLGKIVGIGRFVNSVNEFDFVVDRDENIIFAQYEEIGIGKFFSHVLKIDTQGNQKQIFSGNGVCEAPIIGGDGSIYISFSDRKDENLFYRLNSSGDVIWSLPFQDQVITKPVLDAEGNIYLFAYRQSLTDVRGNFYSINPSGKINWSIRQDSIIWFDPVITKKGIILYGSNVKKTLYAVNKQGQLLWKKKIGQGHGSQGCIIDKDGIFYAVLQDGYLYAIDCENGNVLWKFRSAAGVMSGMPALSNQGYLFQIISSKHLLKIDKNAKEVWRTVINTSTFYSPIIDIDGRILCITISQEYPHARSWIEVFSPSGEKLWEYEMKGSVHCAQIINNKVYAITNFINYSKKKQDNPKKDGWILYKIGDES